MTKSAFRLIICVTVVLLTFSLVSCNLSGLLELIMEEMEDGGYEYGDLPSYLPSSLSKSLADNTVFGLLSDEEKQSIIEDAKKEGSDVSFSGDGTMTVVNDSGSSAVQHPDGSWTVNEKNGTTAQYGGEWPVNDLTSLVPKPEFKLLSASLTDKEFAATFRDVTKDELKAYAQKVKEAGFTVDPQETDMSFLGQDVYTYTASDGNGYSVCVSFAAGTIGMLVAKD